MILEQDYYSRQIPALLRALYIKLIFNPKRVLDAGCGMGNLAEGLRNLGIEAWGVDINEDALSQVSQKFKRFCQKGDVLNLDFSDQSFDLVSTVNVLEHIREKDIKNALSECSRVARRAMYHEITVNEDLRTIDKDPTHRTKKPVGWWFGVLRKLFSQEWKVRNGFSIPVFKNGIFLLERR